MKTDFFLKLTGVQGESIDSKHKGEIDILALNWTISQKTNMHIGQGGAIGQSRVGDIVITKLVDRSSPVLHTYCSLGMKMPEAQIVKRKSGTTPLEYFKISLKEVVISEVQFHLGESGVPDVETVHLSFTEFVEEYTPQSSIGIGDGAVKAGYNMVKRKRI